MNQMEQFEYDGVLGGDGPALVHVVLADVLGVSVEVSVVHRGSGEAVVDGNLSVREQPDCDKRCGQPDTPDMYYDEPGRR